MAGHTANPLYHTLFKILSGMTVGTTFTIKQLAPLCNSTVKRVTEPIRVYQAFGLVATFGDARECSFTYRGFPGIHTMWLIGQRLITKPELKRFLAEDPPSDAQRLYFRQLCITGFKEAKLPTSRQGLDSLVMQAWCFFILQLWLGEASCNRIDLLITVKATARESKSRPRTTILKACRPLIFHNIPMFSIPSGNKPTCRWIGSGVELPRAVVQAPLSMNSMNTLNPKRQMLIIDSWGGDKKQRVSPTKSLPTSPSAEHVKQNPCHLPRPLAARSSYCLSPHVHDSDPHGVLAAVPVDAEVEAGVDAYDAWENMKAVTLLLKMKSGAF